MAASFPAATVGYGLNAFHKTNELGNSTLALDLTGSPSTFTVDNASSVTAWPTDNFVVRIDNELIFCSSRTGESCTINTRGAFGTAQADHDFEATVRVVSTSAFMQQVCAEIQAMQGWAGVGASLVHASVTATPYTATSSDAIIPVDATAGAVTVNLPTAVGIKGRLYVILKTDASSNAVTVDGNASETMGGALTQTLSSQNSAILIYSDGANWLLIGSVGGVSSFYGYYSAGSAPLRVNMPVIWQNQSGSALQSNLQYVTTPPGTGAAALEGGPFHVRGALNSGGGENAPPTGKIVRLAWFGTIVGASALNANQFAGFGLASTTSSALYDTSFMSADRILVGVTSSGNYKVMSGQSSSASTITDTGVAYVSGTYHAFEILYAVSTSIVVKIDGATVATLTTNLPNGTLSGPSFVVIGHGTSSVTYVYPRWAGGSVECDL